MYIVLCRDMDSWLHYSYIANNQFRKHILIFFSLRVSHDTDTYWKSVEYIGEKFQGRFLDSALRIQVPMWFQKLKHTLAPILVSYPPFLCICACRLANCAMDMSTSPLLMCAVCRKFVGTPIILLSILSFWCCCDRLFRVLAGRWVIQHVKHCTQSSLLPAILWCPGPQLLENKSLNCRERITSKEARTRARSTRQFRIV